MANIYNLTASGGIKLGSIVLFDPNFSNVTLLLQDSLRDNSNYSQTIIANGAAGTTNSNYKFGSSSFISQGGNSFLEVNSDPSMALGSGDFTIECFIYIKNFNSVHVFPIFVAKNNSIGSNRPNFYISSNTLVFNAASSQGNVLARSSTTLNISSQTWYHVAVARNGSTIRLFLDGVQVGSANSTINFAHDTFQLCHDDYSTVSEVLFDEFRVTIGVSRYNNTSSNFPVPTSSFQITEKVVFSNYNIEPIGGILSFPESINNQIINLDYLVSTKSAGTAQDTHISSMPTTGGMVCSGTSFQQFFDVFESDGGCVLGSRSFVGLNYANILVDGSISISGESIVEISVLSFGGINLGGSSELTLNDTIETSGGVGVSGVAEKTFSDIVGSLGGVSLGGVSPVQVLTTQGSSSGVYANGNVELSSYSQFLPIGGINLGGSSELTLNDEIETSGGVGLSGVVRQNFTINTIASSLGSLLNGEFNVESNYNLQLSFLGVKAAGLSVVEIAINASGGVRASGLSDQNFYDFFEADGGSLAAGESDETFTDYINLLPFGILINGTSFFNKVFSDIFATGGSTASGSAVVEIKIDTSGGVEVSGLADENFYDFFDTEGGAVLNGLSLVSQNKFYLAEGNVLTNGQSEISIIDVKFNGKGGISLSNSESIVTNLYFIKTISLLYDINSEINPEISFNWNIGALEMYWYRVVGKGSSDPCFPTDPCCQRITLNVHARSLSELCEKLSKRRFKFPVETVQRFTRPALTSVVRENEANGASYDCNNLIDVNICDIPACADFCVDQDVFVSAGFGISVAVDSFYEYRAGGELDVAGSADVVFVRDIPRFYQFGEGGLELEGSSYIQKDFYSFRGGIVLSGESRIGHTRWSYTGGEWPDSLSRRPISATSISNIEDEKPWLVVERVLISDDLYTRSDITYGSTSELLVISNLGFDSLPDWARVVGVVVNVSRLSGTNGVRDEEVFLLNGQQRLSENMAIVDVDWPLLDTVRTYGPIGWFGENSFNGLAPLYPLIRRDQVVREDFGVGIRVKSTKDSTDTTPTLAYIDYVEVNIEYEDPRGSIIRFSSDSGATAKSSGYTSVSVGRVMISGQSDFYKTETYRFISIGGLEASGFHNILYYEESTDGVNIDGKFRVTPFLEFASGGAKQSGFATVKPYWNVMIGGASVRPYSNMTGNWQYVSNGILNIEGQAFAPEVKWQYNPENTSNTITLGGSIFVRNNNYNFKSEGNVLFVFGGASYTPGDILIDRQIFGYNIIVHDIAVNRINDVEVGDAQGVFEIIQQCGCFNLPSILTLNHNIAQDNLFAKFLVRNNMTISKDIRIKYNKTNNSWQHNLHYKGYSSGSLDIESWNVVFELQCSNNIGGVVTGQTIWKLTIYLNRKVYSRGINSDTKIIVSILPSTLCLTTVSELDFVINYDVYSNLAFVNPESTIYYNNIYDNIGIFANRAWIENSNLRLSLKQVPLSQEYGIRDGVPFNLTDAVYVNN